MQLTNHFALEEFTTSRTAAANSIDNTPSDGIIGNIKDLARWLETLRAKLDGKKIVISSGYRCEELNKLVGGSPASQHMQGLAADILIPEVGTPYQVCEAILNSGLKFDQMIHEFGQWCHISVTPGLTPGRQQVLTTDGPGKYKKGLFEVTA